MRIGGAMFLIAVGAILRWAVTRDHLSGINMHVVGLILFIIGIVWLLFEAVYWMTQRNRTVVSRTTPGATYVEQPGYPVDRY
jgi:uncharacterized BrkB/YihY/UPF0761 family membrane protein